MREEQDIVHRNDIQGNTKNCKEQDDGEKLKYFLPQSSHQQNLLTCDQDKIYTFSKNIHNGKQISVNAWQNL